MIKSILPGALAIAMLAAWPHAQQQPPPAAPQQPSEIETTITGEGGAAPRLAVPDFIALSSDAETAAMAKTIGQVLWDDLNYEREFAFIPRDTYATIPRATSFTAWRTSTNRRGSNSGSSGAAERPTTAFNAAAVSASILDQ